jgi:hypothetical protein
MLRRPTSSGDSTFMANEMVITVVIGDSARFVLRTRIGQLPGCPSSNKKNMPAK